MRPGVLIMFIYSYLYYDVTQVTIIKDYLLTYLLSSNATLGKSNESTCNNQPFVFAIQFKRWIFSFNAFF